MRWSPGVAELQAALAGEHAALYAYGVIGGRSGDHDRSLAWTAYARHRARRDRLIAIVSGRGEEPVPAQVGYQLPFAVDDRPALRRLAVLVERRCATLYAAAVAATHDEIRLFAAHSLTECAVTALAWGDPGEPFPGLGRR